MSAKRLSRYWYSLRYSHTDDGDEGAVVIASQEYCGRLTVSCAVLHDEHPFFRDIDQWETWTSPVTAALGRNYLVTLTFAIWDLIAPFLKKD